MSKLVRTIIELFAVAVGLVGGYLYFDELGRVWLFWILAALVILIALGWRGRHRIARLLAERADTRNRIHLAWTHEGDLPGLPIRPPHPGAVHRRW